MGVAGELLTQIESNIIGGEIVAILNNTTEELRGANLALEKELAPRDLKGIQPTALYTLGKSSPGKVMAVSSYALDVEGARLCEQIVTALGSSHVAVVRNNCLSISGFGTVTWGVSVWGNDGQLADSLRSILHTAGTTKPSFGGATMVMGDALATVDANVFVGVKPLPK